MAQPILARSIRATGLGGPEVLKLFTASAADSTSSPPSAMYVRSYHS